MEAETEGFSEMISLNILNCLLFFFQQHRCRNNQILFEDIRNIGRYIKHKFPRIEILKQIRFNSVCILYSIVNNLNPINKGYFTLVEVVINIVSTLNSLARIANIVSDNKCIKVYRSFYKNTIFLR